MLKFDKILVQTILCCSAGTYLTTEIFHHLYFVYVLWIPT